MVTLLRDRFDRTSGGVVLVVYKLVVLFLASNLTVNVVRAYKFMAARIAR
jgi:hypothetical protein